MEDVYFERIAGVGERTDGSQPRQPQAVQPQGRPVLNMALDDGVPVANLNDEPASMSMASGPANPSNVECDENGFPLSPLRDQEELWFMQAAALYRPIAKGVSLARSSGMFLLFSGFLALLSGALSTDPMALAVGVVLVALGFVERNSAAKLSEAQPSAATKLALNQLFVFALIAGSSYITASGLEAETAQAMTMTEAELAQIPPEAQGFAQSLSEMGPKLIYVIFGAMVAISALFQGALALYYFSRRKKVKTFLSELPPWVSNIVTTVSMR